MLNEKKTTITQNVKELEIKLMEIPEKKTHFVDFFYRKYLNCL